MKVGASLPGASLPGPSREGLRRVALGSSEASPRVVANDRVLQPGTAGESGNAWHQLPALGACSESLQKLPVICAALVQACMKMKRAGSLQPGRSCLCSARRQLPSSWQGSWQPEGVMGWLCAPTPPGQLGG